MLMPLLAVAVIPPLGLGIAIQFNGWPKKTLGNFQTLWQQWFLRTVYVMMCPCGYSEHWTEQLIKTVKHEDLQQLILKKHHWLNKTYWWCTYTLWCHLQSCISSLEVGKSVHFNDWKSSVGTAQTSWNPDHWWAAPKSSPKVPPLGHNQFKFKAKLPAFESKFHIPHQTLLALTSRSSVVGAPWGNAFHWNRLW